MRVLKAVAFVAALCPAGCVAAPRPQTCIFEFEDGKQVSYSNVRRVTFPWFEDNAAKVHAVDQAIPVVVSGYTRFMCLRPSDE